jgi:hypothetical protein
MNNLRSLLRYWNWQVVYVPLREVQEFWGMLGTGAAAGQ